MIGIKIDYSWLMSYHWFNNFITIITVDNFALKLVMLLNFIFFPKTFHCILELAYTHVADNLGPAGSPLNFHTQRIPTILLLCFVNGVLKECSHMTMWSEWWNVWWQYVVILVAKSSGRVSVKTNTLKT